MLTGETQRPGKKLRWAVGLVPKCARIWTPGFDPYGRVAALLLSAKLSSSTELEEGKKEGRIRRAR
jgi:hypothetical protein